MDSPALPDRFLQRICDDRKQFGFVPIRGASESFANGVLALLYPHFAELDRCDEDAVRHDVGAIDLLLNEILGAVEPKRALDVRNEFWSALPRLKESIDADADAITRTDPAAADRDEVILCYPGFFAVAIHRIAHFFEARAIRLFPRTLSEYAHRQTGVDIHAGASIGHGFAIDHGTGIVIGGTTVIGDRVRLYQGVTLGALAVQKVLAGKKRHPTIEDDVVIYSNSTILGGDTVVGARAVIGGNVWLTESVPPGALVTRTSIVRAREDALEFHI